jgi:hypothetical protein
MIKKIKNKVSTISVDFSYKNIEYRNNFKNTVLAELHLVEKFKETNLNTEENSIIEEIDEKIENKDNKFVSVSTETLITMEDKETFIGFVYFNEATQTEFNNFGKLLSVNIAHPRMSKEIESELLQLHVKGMIPDNADLES